MIRKKSTMSNQDLKKESESDVNTNDLSFALPKNSKLILLGVSMGAVVASAFTARFPKLVSGLSLLVPVS